MPAMPWILKLGGFVLLAAAAFLLIRKLLSRPRPAVDYTQYPRATATVVGDAPFYDDGIRQLVRFTDQDGKEVLAMHDKRNLAGLPEPGTVQQVCYWPVRWPTHYTCKRQSIRCYFHYCDEQVYEDAKRFLY